MPGCPIRKSADHRSFAPARGLSQLITSFLACESLGIRHTPFTTFARTGPEKTGPVDYTFSFNSLPHPIHNCQLSIVNCQLSIVNYIQAWRFALHFAFASNMSKNDCEPRAPNDKTFTVCHSATKSRKSGNPRGLDLSAGPVPVFLYIIYRDRRIAVPRNNFMRTSQYR